jgi:hypothetical protein
MASRSNTALHVAVILLILLVVVLGITTYVFYSKQDAHYNDAQAAETKYNNELKRANDNDFAYNLLKVVVGKQTYQPVELDGMRTNLKASNPTLSAELEAIEAQFKQDMQMFPAGYAQTKDYTTLPQMLFGMNKAVNSQLVDAQTRERSLSDERDTTSTTANNDVTATKAELAKVKAEKDAALAAAAVAEAKLRADSAKLAADSKTKDEVYKQEKDKLEQEKKALDTLLANREQTVKMQADKLKAMMITSFERPDGRIVRVNQQQQTVWIDLGHIDGLRRQQTFAIYDQNEANFQDAKPKASIEVTIVKESKLAEARILNDDITDPILPGDIVFSPTWQPGQRLHFALAGFLDINGDGKSDANTVRNLITLNGGVIDAEVDEQGRRTGTVSIETRYIIVGLRPTEATAAAATTAYSTLITEAENFGIEKMSIDKLLAMMGYTPEVNTTQLGGRAGGDTTGGASKFRPRTPDAYAP